MHSYVFASGYRIHKVVARREECGKEHFVYICDDSTVIIIMKTKTHN